MADVIARRELVGVTRSGERISVVVEISRPYPIGDLNGNWRCPVSITPLCHRTFDIGGFDALQALSLAISLAYSELVGFVQQGGRLLYPDTDQEFSLDEPFISPGRDA
jgi:hypothetical protein